MCVLSIKVPIRKKSGNLSHVSRIYRYYVSRKERGPASIEESVDTSIRTIEDDIKYQRKADFTSLKQYKDQKNKNNYKTKMGGKNIV